MSDENLPEFDVKLLENLLGVSNYIEDLKHKAPMRIKEAQDSIARFNEPAPMHFSGGMQPLSADGMSGSRGKAFLPEPEVESDELEVQYHAVTRLLNETAFYPPHDKRESSSAYRKEHNRLVKELKCACLVCGVQYDTLNDPEKNPFGAICMETHHHLVEWALANAIDPVKFNTKILPGLMRRRPDKYGHYKDVGMTREDISAWVDHDPDNLWVLCDVHHRDKKIGIHSISYPIWGPQDIVEIGLVQKMIELAKKGS